VVRPGREFYPITGIESGVKRTTGMIANQAGTGPADRKRNPVSSLGLLNRKYNGEFGEFKPNPRRTARDSFRRLDSVRLMSYRL
jgi:hypothetical protein